MKLRVNNSDAAHESGYGQQIQQNDIIKIFSIAAVVLLPPTLVASTYGMNFEFMPELKWFFGYPLAVALMVVSAVLPYLYFKRKGWL